MEDIGWLPTPKVQFAVKLDSNCTLDLGPKYSLQANWTQTVLWAWAQSTACMQNGLKLYFGPGPPV